MKKLTLLVLTATALSVATAATASRYTARLVSAAREAGWSETQIDRLQGLCSDYERAATALHEFQTLSGLKTKNVRTVTVEADVRDHAIQQIAKVAKAQRNRYEVLRKTVTRYDPSRTNLFVRAARASMQTKLAEARERAETFFVQATNHLAQAQIAERARQLAVVSKESSEARLATVRANLQAKRDEYQAKYNSASVLTKSVYKAIVQVFDSLLSNLN